MNKFDGKNLKNYFEIIISLAGMIFVSIGALSNSVGVYYGPVSADLGVLRGSYVLSQTIWNAVMAFCAYMMSSRFTKHNFKKLLVVGVCLTTLTLLAQSKATALWQIYLLSVIRGFSVSLYGLVVVSSSINFWFKKNSSIITSAILAFSGIGGAILSPVFNNIIENAGWRKAYVFMAVLNVIFTLPAMLTKYTLKPQFVDGLPYGGSSESVKNINVDYKVNLKDFIFIGCLICVILNTFPTFITQQFSGYTSFLMLGSGIGAMMVSANMVGNISSKFLFGVIAEKLKVFKSLVIFILINVCGTLLLIFARSNTALLAAALLHGFVYAVGATGFVMLIKEMFGIENYPKVYSMISLVSACTGFLISSFLGYVYDITKQYYPIFILALIGQALTLTVVYKLSKESQKKAC